MPEPQKLTPSQKAGGIAALCVAAAGACISLTQSSEGLRNRPYLDPAHILTVCYGETQGIDQARIYSNDECAAKLRRRLAEDYAPRIAAANCLPQVATERRVKVFGALLDAAYNAGPVAVCNSRMARSIRAGDWAGACNGFYGWYATARDRRTGKRIQLRGLEIRRQKEAALCREGARP
jgi:lysozyme